MTPVIAVVREIWKVRPRAKVEFWTDKKYYKNVQKLAFENEMDLRVRKIAAGKLRRYTNFKFIDYLQHFDVILQNVMDFFRIIGGFIQSFCRLVGEKNRPDVIFLKGGYVCLPVGVVAHWLKIPYVIHDSDATPGLTNRVLAKHATKVATGMPLKYYSYPEDKAVWTGIPINQEFRPASEKKQKSLKKEFGFNEDEPLLVVTGGSQGAEHINLAIKEILPDLLKFTSVLLIAGRMHYANMLDLKEYETWEDGELKSNFRMLEFSGEMFKLFGAADVVVSRAGASTMTELSSMAKAVIMVPNQKLPGYHQVKNAETYAKEDAAIVVSDEKMNKDPQVLLKEIKKLIKDKKKREELGENLKNFSKDNAAKNLADIVLDVVSATAASKD